MKYNLSENIHKLTDEFIEKRIPAKEEDKLLYAKYMEAVDAGEERLPVFKGSEGAEGDYPVLTHYGLAKLSADFVYMNYIYIPKIMSLYYKDVATFSEKELHLVRASLIDFALLGCFEAQTLLFSRLGGEWNFITQMVEHRWPNLQRLSRFLTAQSGAGHFEDYVPTYEDALAEVKSGSKRSHWIWYIFPQMYGIPGTHSGNALYYGIRGRMEAIQYICHPLLRQRLVDLCRAILSTGKSVCDIFPENDAMKVQSCINLFDSVSEIPELREVKKKNHWIG